MSSPTRTAPSTAPPRISARRIFKPARGFGAGSCSGGSGSGTLTSAALSSPTSISTLIVSSLRVSPFHLANRAREVGASLIKAVQSRDLVVVGAGERILGGNDLDIVGYPGLEAVARLLNLIMSQLNAEIRYAHFVAGGVQIEQRCFHIESNLVSQVLFLLLDFLQFQVGFGDFGLDTAAGEERYADGRLILVRRDAVRTFRAEIRPIAVETQRRQSLVLRSLSFEFRGLFLSLDGFPFLAARKCQIDAGFHFRLGSFKEAQGIGQFDFLARVQVQKLAETKQRSFAVIHCFDEALVLILQFNVGSQRVDAGADSFLLQVGGLVIKRLREVDTRLRRFNVRDGAERADILRNNKQNDLLASAQARGPRFVDFARRRLVTLPQRKIKNRTTERRAGGEELIRANVSGNGKSRQRREYWLAAKKRLQVLPIGRIGDFQVRLGQQLRKGDLLVLNAFGSVEQADLLGGILLNGQGNGLLES